MFIFYIYIYRIHDRKLCVMGLLTLMSLSPNRPIAVNEHANQIVPSMLMLFDGLNRAYNSKHDQFYFFMKYLVKILIKHENVSNSIIIYSYIVNMLPKICYVSLKTYIFLRLLQVIQLY